jgi:hypothetical protein
MTDALVHVNDRLAEAARAQGFPAASFYCECGDCLAEAVPLSLAEHDELRAREDLIFAQGHDTPTRYRHSAPDSGEWRAALTRSLMRVVAARV